MNRFSGECREVYEDRLIKRMIGEWRNGRFIPVKRVNNYTRAKGHKHKRQIWVEGKGLIDLPYNTQK